MVMLVLKVNSKSNSFTSPIVLVYSIIYLSLRSYNEQKTLYPSNFTEPDNLQVIQVQFNWSKLILQLIVYNCLPKEPC